MQARKPRAAAQSAQQIEEQDDDHRTPADMAAFRIALARRLWVIMGNRLKRWRSCREPSCKRGRQCCAPRGTCSNRKQSRRPMKPEHAARAKAMLYRMLQERHAQREAEAVTHQSADRSHQKS
jgi:hypothetical protein